MSLELPKLLFYLHEPPEAVLIQRPKLREASKLIQDIDMTLLALEALMFVLPIDIEKFLAHGVQQSKVRQASINEGPALPPPRYYPFHDHACLALEPLFPQFLTQLLISRNIE